MAMAAAIVSTTIAGLNPQIMSSLRHPSLERELDALEINLRIVLRLMLLRQERTHSEYPRLNGLAVNVDNHLIVFGWYRANISVAEIAERCLAWPAEIDVRTHESQPSEFLRRIV
jgi:hypothetical protein